MQALISPLKQGSLDDLCGIYAIINALAKLGVISTFNQAEVMMDVIIRETNIKDAISGGLSVKELLAVLKIVKSFFPYEFTIERPFCRTKLNTTKLWNQIEKENKKTSIILGLGPPVMHWTVFDYILFNKVYFYDSHTTNDLPKPSLTFDKQERSMKTWIKTNEIIILRNK